MKNIIFLLISFLLLASCQTNSINKTDINNKNNKTNLNTNQKTMTKTIVVDSNHPLAGKTLNFDIEIVSITKKPGNELTDTVENGDQVKVHYTGTFTDGTKFDSSLDRGEPLEFTAGAGQMIPGFDKAVIGMKKDEKKSVTLEPKDAYGEKDPNKKQEITLKPEDVKNLQNAGYEIKVGEKLPTMAGELEILEVK